MSQIVKCRICGAPYRFYPYHAGDQSACSDCRAEATRAIDEPTEHERARRARRRRAYYGSDQEGRL